MTEFQKKPDSGVKDHLSEAREDLYAAGWCQCLMNANLWHPHWGQHTLSAACRLQDAYDLKHDRIACAIVAGMLVMLWLILME